MMSDDARLTKKQLCALEIDQRNFEGFSLSHRDFLWSYPRWLVSAVFRVTISDHCFVVLHNKGELVV